MKQSQSMPLPSEQTCAAPAKAASVPDPCVPASLTPQERIARFSRICTQAMQERRSNGNAGIGTLAEKWQHQIIKRYLTEQTDCHEVRLPGTRYVSDVRIGQWAYEVQTGSFTPLRRKIDYYLSHTDLSVTIVRPIAQNRWVSVIDAETHAISPRRRSPRHGRAEELLPELYSLLPYLGNPRLRFNLLMLEVYDFRLSAGNSRRRGAGTRFERIPLSLLGELSLSSAADFARFLPPALPSPFTVKQFSAQTRLRGRDAYSAVRVLTALGLLRPAPAIGRAMAFHISPTVP